MSTPSQALQSIEEAVQKARVDLFQLQEGARTWANDLFDHIEAAISCAKEVTPLDPPWLPISMVSPAPEDELMWAMRADGSIDLVYCDHGADSWCTPDGVLLEHGYIARLPPIPAFEQRTDPLGSPSPDPVVVPLPQVTVSCPECFEDVDSSDVRDCKAYGGFICNECADRCESEAAQRNSELDDALASDGSALEHVDREDVTAPWDSLNVAKIEPTEPMHVSGIKPPPKPDDWLDWGAADVLTIDPAATVTIHLKPPPKEDEPDE